MLKFNGAAKWLASVLLFALAIQSSDAVLVVQSGARYRTPGSSAFVEPQRYNLVITSPRSTLASNHRVRRQYPGIPYNIRVTALHGAFPFTYALTANAPSGMSIDSNGVVTWANPTTGTYTNITVQVTDAAGATATETWTLVVGTSGHQFMDCDNTGESAAVRDGSNPHPWIALSEMYTEGTADAITWIADCATDYLLTDLPTSSDVPAAVETFVEWETALRSTIWVGYGAAKPIIDFEHDGSYCSDPPTCTGVRATARMRMIGDNTWIDNIRVEHSFIQAFQMEASVSLLGWTVRRMEFVDCGPGLSGSNAGHVMSRAMGTNGSTPRYGTYFGENTNTGMKGQTGLPVTALDTVKLYSEEYALIADNTISNNTVFGTDGAIAVKGGRLDHIEVRANTCTSYLGVCLGGNMAGNPTGANDFEARFNLMHVSGTDPVTTEVPWCLHIGQGQSPSNIHYYRNTCKGGRIRVRQLSTAVGPYNFTRNVIENEDGSQLIPHFCDGGAGTGGWGDCSGLTDTSIIVESQNLKGNAAAAMTDANGLLQGSYLTQYGPLTATPRGHKYQ